LLTLIASLFEIAWASGIPVITGEPNACHGWRKIIALSGTAGHGSGAFAQLCAAHEVAHHRPGAETPWPHGIRWFAPVRWSSEFDAWHSAVEALA